MKAVVVDVKPEAPAGDLISDEAWHKDWCVASLEADAASLSSVVASRELNHESVFVYLNTSREAHTAEFLTAAHSVSDNKLAHDKKITAQAGKEHAACVQIANFLTTARTQMTNIATYEEAQAKTFETKGDSDKAKETRDNAKSEINGIGQDLKTSIDGVVTALKGEKS